MSKLPKIITREEFNKLLDATLANEFRKKNNRVKALCMILGFEAGLRISEIVGHKGKSRKTNKQTGEVIEADTEIPKLTKERIDYEGQIMRILGKRGKERVVPLPKLIKPSHLKLLPVKLTRRALQHHVETISKEVLGRKISFHTLRAGFATTLLDNRVPLHHVQILLGHERGETTMIYARANPKDALESARRVF